MKTRLISIVTMLLVSASSLLFGQAKIEVVGGTKLDLGYVDRGSSVDKKVTIKNLGKDTLILGRVEASCGCTGTLTSNDRIAPGKTGEVTISFNSRAFSGPVHKTVTVNSNDPESPRTTIEFTANVIEEVSLSPSQLYLKDAMVGKATPVIFTVKNQGSEPLEIKSYTTSLTGLTLDLPKEPIKPGVSVEIKGEFKPPAVKPVISDNLFIQTSNKKQSEVYIYVYGNVKEFRFE